MTDRTESHLTLIDDGQTRWLAKTDTLVAQMARLGYSAEMRRGYHCAVQPIATDTDEADGDPYGTLCSYVPEDGLYMVDDDLQFVREAQTMTYDPHATGPDAWRISRGLYHALTEHHALDAL